jgi:hypothetical protein
MTSVTKGGSGTVIALSLTLDQKPYAYSGRSFVNRRECHVSSDKAENGHSTPQED